MTNIETQATRFVDVTESFNSYMESVNEGFTERARVLDEYVAQARENHCQVVAECDALMLEIRNVARNTPELNG